MSRAMDKFYTQVTKGMFLDYTKDFCEQFSQRADTDISLKEILDFIDYWIDNKFPEREKSDG